MPSPGDTRRLPILLCAGSILALVGVSHSDEPLQGAAAFGDWHADAPGVKRHIRVGDLPAPYATQSSARPPSVVAPPADSLPRVPEGFTVSRYLAGLDNPRALRTAPNGDVFVAETRAGRIRVLRPADGSSQPAQVQVYASGLDGPFGMAFYPLSGAPQWLYVATNNQVMRFAYRDGDLKARDKPELLVRELSATTRGHTTRDLVFTADGRQLLVSVGSLSNIANDLPRRDAAQARQHEAGHGLGAAWGDEAGRAMIQSFDPEGHPAPLPFATGIRNCVGLTRQPATGAIWCATNERDGRGDDLVPDYATRVKAGQFFGWPWYYLGAHEDPEHRGERPDLAGKVSIPDVLLQAHSAAVGIAFYPQQPAGVAAFPAEYRGEAFVALHGSWNRSARTGYKVVRLLMADGQPTGVYEDFMTGFVLDDARVWGRPVGITVLRDGALLVSDDGSGSLWRVAPAAVH